MAVTDATMVAALRLGSSAEELAEAQRLRSVASAIVEKRASGAPDAIKDEAVIRIAAHLFDRPNYVGKSSASILQASGAGDLLLPYVAARAVSTDA